MISQTAGTRRAFRLALCVLFWLGSPGLAWASLTGLSGLDASRLKDLPSRLETAALEQPACTAFCGEAPRLELEASTLAGRVPDSWHPFGPGPRDEGQNQALFATEWGSWVVEYANDNPTRYTDPTGHYSEPGHYYTVLLAATAVGYSPREAQQLAFFAQLPDETTRLDAIAVKVSAELSRGTRATSDTVQTKFHALTGSASARETATTLEAIRDAGDDRAVTGLLLHRLGDSFAHRQIKDEDTTYETGLGHFRDGHTPDTILKRPGLYLEYVQTLVGALAEKKGLSEQERVAALAKVTPFGIQPNALPVLFTRGEAGDLQPEVRKLVERHLGYGDVPPLPGQVHQVDGCLGSDTCLETVALSQIKREAGRFGAPLDYAPESTGFGYGSMVKGDKPVATVVEEFRSATGGRGAGYSPQQIDEAARRAEELVKRRAAQSP